MPTYLTVKEVAAIFRTTEKTVRQWISDERDITFDGKRYNPQKDPGGNWLFIISVIAIASTDDELRPRPAGAHLRRRVLSSGIK